ncbi:MAG: hypothetical protein ACHP84_15265 [Caulobacterales bacterium]
MSVRSLLFCLALAPLALPSLASAAAQPEDKAFDAFQQVCVAPVGEFADVVKAADGGGWTSAQVLAETPPGVSNTDKAARGKNVDGTDLRLFATRGIAHPKGGDVVMSTCTVNSNIGNLGDLPTRAQTMLGVAPVSTTATSATFHVAGGQGAWRSVADNGVDAAIAGGGLDVITVKTEGTSVILDYIKITK